MRLLFAGQGYPGVPGTSSGSGIGTYLHELTLGLTAQGHTCHVVVWGEPGSAPVQEIDGVTIFLLPHHRWQVVERWFPEAGDLWNRRRFLSRLFSRYHYDWIEIQSDEGIDIGIQKALPDRTILRIHTILAQMVKYKEVPITPRNRPYLAREEQSFRLARRVLVSSDFHAAELVALFPWMVKPVVVHLGIDFPVDLAVDPRVDLSNPPHFLVIGSPDLRKGYDRLRPVLEAYGQRHGPCQLVLISACTEEQKDKFQLTAPFPHGVDIVCRAKLTDRELHETYQNASVFLHLARYESFGYPLVEAAAFGLPVVATNTGIAADLLTGPLRRFIIAGDDPFACANALAEAVANRSQFSALVRSSYQRQFTRAHMVECYLNAMAQWRNS